MSQRLNHQQQSPALFKKFLAFSAAIKSSSLDPLIAHLIDIRASQLNGCAFCLDMHVKAARLEGERELRLHHVAIWRESALFSARERAALAWTEALTRLPPEGVSDELYAQTLAQFSETELSDLTYRVMAINGWNRASIAFRVAPGAYDAAYGLDKAALN